MKRTELMLIGLSSSICAILLTETNYQIAKSKVDIPSSYAKLPLHNNENHFCKGPKKRMQIDPLRESMEFPNQHYFEYRNQKARFHSYNRHGYRSNSPNGEDPKDITNVKKSVWVFGDSFTRGSLADNSETIPSQLTKLSNNDMTFVNFGVGGHGYLNALRHLEWASQNMKHIPKAIIFIGHANDIMDDQRASARFKELSSYRDQSQITPIEPITPTWKAALKNFPYAYSRLSMIKYTAKNFIIPRINRVPNSPISLPQKYLDQSKTNHAQFLNKAQSITSLVFSAYIPSLYEDKVPGYEGMDTLNRKIMRESAKTINSSYLYLSFEKITEIAKSRKINLSSRFDIHGSPDMHYNELGYYLAALAISDQISSYSNLEFKSKLTSYDSIDYSKTEACPL